MHERFKAKKKGVFYFLNNVVCAEKRKKRVCLKKFLHPTWKQNLLKDSTASRKILVYKIATNRVDLLKITNIRNMYTFQL